MSTWPESTAWLASGNLMSRMKLIAAAALLLAWAAPVGATYVTLTGAGGVSIGAGPLTPPSILPAISSAFDQNGANGDTTNALTVPTAAADLPATTSNSWVNYFEGTVDNNLSSGVNQEYLLGVASASITALGVSAQTGAGAPQFFTQFDRTNAFRWWNGSAGINVLTGSNLPYAPLRGSGYNFGAFPWTATGGGCSREPSGWYENYNEVAGATTSLVFFADPGFGCQTTPWLVTSTIPGVGATQGTGIANGGSANTTCVSNSPIAGEMTVTATVATAHGVQPGHTGLTLAGFTPSGFNLSNYAALAGTGGTTLVLESTTGGGTCPASSPSVEGTALTGAGGTILFSSIDNYSSLQGTGITTKGNQKFCGVEGEYGADSPTPGVQFVRILDAKTGLDLVGSPAIPSNLNQGASNVTGYVTNTAQNTTATFTASITAAGVMNVTVVTGTPFQVGTYITGPSLPTTYIASLGTGTGGTGTYNLANTNIGQALPSSNLYTYHNYAPALTVTALNSYTITNAVYASTRNGQVTFTTGAGPTPAHGLSPGSLFDVTGMSPSGYNGRYIAIAGTSGSTLVGVSWPVAALANPGSFVSGGAETSEVMPGALVVGAYGSAQVSPFGTYGSTGTGGVGTYALSVNQSTWTFTGTASGTTALNVTAQPGTTSFEYLAAGVGFTGTSVTGGTYIATSFTGGGVGSTYAMNQSNTFSSETLTTTGDIWSSGSPGNIYMANAFVWTPTPSTTGGGYGQLASVTAATLGNFASVVGAYNAGVGSFHGQWGGNAANWHMGYGVFPQDSSGNPSLTSLQSICNKTTDFLAFDTANSITPQLLYRMSDPGIFGDSSNATITGYITAASGTTATLNVASTLTGSLTLATGTQTAYLTGPGLAGGNASVPSFTLTTSASSTYTLTWGSSIAANLGSSGSPVTLNVGKNKPLTPNAPAQVNGYITTSGGSGPCATQSCLNVTSFVTSAGYWAGSATLSGSSPPPTYTTLTINSTTTGTPADDMACFDSTPTDLTGPPLLIKSGSGSTWTVLNNYYQPFGPDANIYCTLSIVTPNQTIVASTNVPYPAQITGYVGGSNGGIGAYTLSNSLNGTVGSSGSPVAMTLTGIVQGGASAPGPALTITDHGPGTTYALNNFPSASPTGSIPLVGTYTTGSLGGTPSAIQAQLSTSADGPAVSGFSWANLSSQTISGGNWSGTISGVPPGQYYVAVRAANGTSYVNLPNPIMVGAVFDATGEGNMGACLGGGAGTFTSFAYGLMDGQVQINGDDQMFGPPVVNAVSPSFSQASTINQYGVGGGVFF
jgi:hypothetical protein